MSSRMRWVDFWKKEEKAITNVAQNVASNELGGGGAHKEVFMKFKQQVLQGVGKSTL